MYISNITFIIPPEEEEKLIHWLRTSAIPALFNNESPARNPALRKVVEAGGEKPAPDHGLSIALHAEFDSETPAKEWNDTFLLPTLAAFHAEFGPNALFFVTLLENIII